jgi:hypothetical protein
LEQRRRRTAARRFGRRGEGTAGGGEVIREAAAREGIKELEIDMDMFNLTVFRTSNRKENLMTALLTSKRKQPDV